MKNTVTHAKNLLYIIFGTLVLAFGTAVFILPFDLVVGGVSSIAIITEKLIPNCRITAQQLITFITWSLFFAGLIFLGREFALKTLVSTIIYPIGISLFSTLVNPNVMNGIFCLDRSQYSQIVILLAALFGGVFSGAGCALTFLGGGSTGGVDIIAFLICKLSSKFRNSVVIFLIDTVTIICGLIVIGDFVITLLGVSSAFVTAIVIDKLFLGESSAFVAHIVTDQYELINNLVLDRLDRSTSIIDIEGGFSRQAKKMLMVSFSMNQYNELLNIINLTDKGAFVTIHRAHQINGEGWTWQPDKK